MRVTKAKAKAKTSAKQSHTDTASKPTVTPRWRRRSPHGVCPRAYPPRKQ